MKKLFFSTYLIILFLLAIVSFIILAYFFEWDWSGFGEIVVRKTENYEIRPAKSLWDLLDLLIIPLALGAGTILIQRMEKNRELMLKEDTKLRLAGERENLFIKHRIELSDSMNEVLMTKGLDTRRDSNDYVQLIDTFRKLNGTGNRLLINNIIDQAPSKLKSEIEEYFVSSEEWRSGHFDRSPNMILMIDAYDMRAIDFKGVYLYGFAFIGVNNSFSDFSESILRNSVYDRCFVKSSNYSNSYLNEIHLVNSTFENTDFSNTFIKNAFIIDCNIINSSFIDAKLKNIIFNRNVILDGCDFRGAEIEHIHFGGAMLDGCDFRGAKITNKEIFNNSFYKEKQPIFSKDSKISIKRSND